jgi:hypothetical protein
MPGTWGGCCVAAQPHARSSVAAEERRQAGLAARADEQRRWVMQGDERGIYGQYPATCRFLRSSRPATHSSPESINGAGP